MDGKKKKSVWLAVSIASLIYLIVGLGESPCVTRTENRTVRGNSMSGLIEMGRNIKILYDYYNCNPVQRGDIVAYGYRGNPNTIVKMVRGMPGDSFSTENNRLNINGQPVTNSNNQPYSLDEETGKMLALYVKDYQGKIPSDTYLILGNITHGSLDSTCFGLVGKNDIIGKVIY